MDRADKDRRWVLHRVLGYGDEGMPSEYMPLGEQFTTASLVADDHLLLRDDGHLFLTNSGRKLLAELDEEWNASGPRIASESR